MSDQPIAAWTSPSKPTVEWGDAYSGVMVDTTEALWDICDKMPVILHPDEHETWLWVLADEAIAAVPKYPADPLVVDRMDEPWFKRKSIEKEGPTPV